jgi:hypothetical protein
MKLLKTSKAGIAVATLYVLVAMTIFVAHIYSVKTNPADSGESAIPFFMLALPWVMFVPASWHHLPAWSWLAYPVLWFCVTFNAFLIYSAVGLVTSIVQWAWGRFLYVARNR